MERRPSKRNSKLAVAFAPTSTAAQDGKEQQSADIVDKLGTKDASRAPSSSKAGESGDSRTTSSAGVGRTSSTLVSRQDLEGGGFGKVASTPALVSKKDMDQIRQVISLFAPKSDSVQFRYRLLEKLASIPSTEFRWWPPTSEMRAAVHEQYRKALSEREDKNSSVAPPPTLDQMISMYREMLQHERTTSKKMTEAFDFATSHDGETELNLAHSVDMQGKLQRAWPGGRCTIKEFEAAFACLPVQPTEAQLRFMFFKLQDRHGDRGVSEFELQHETFVAAYEEILVVQEGLRLSRAQELERLFRYLDIRKQGYIRLTEIVARFPAEEKDLVSRQIETLLQYFDTDKNGKIDSTEFPSFYEGFLKLQNLYNLSDDGRLEETWREQAESTLRKTLTFSDVEFLSSAFQAIDVKKKLAIPIQSVLFALENAEGGPPTNEEIEHLSSEHQRSFAHGTMDISEFIQIHKDLRRLRVAASGEDMGLGSPLGFSFVQTDDPGGGEEENKSGSQGVFFLRKGEVGNSRSTFIQDALLKKPKDRSKAELTAVVKLFRMSHDLDGVEGAALFQMAKTCGCGYFQAGQKLIREGDPSNDYWLVVSGSVSVSVRAGGGEPFQVAEIGAGSGFGEIGLVFEQPRRCTVAAARDGALVATVDRETFFRAGMGGRLRGGRWQALAEKMEVLSQLPFLAGRLDTAGLFSLSHFLRQRIIRPRAPVYQRAEDAVEVAGVDDLRAETLPGEKLIHVVQAGLCDAWAESDAEGKEVCVSSLPAASWVGPLCTGRSVTRVTASGSSSALVYALRLEDALARLPRDVLVDLLDSRQRQDAFIKRRVKQLESSGGVRSFLRGGRPLKDLQTALSSGKAEGAQQREEKSEQQEHAAADAWETESQRSSIGPAGWVDEHVERVMEVKKAKAHAFRVRLTSKPEMPRRHTPLSDDDIKHPLKSRWPLQNAFLLHHPKVKGQTVLDGIRRTVDTAVPRYHHPKVNRPPTAPPGHAHWMEEMEYPQPVAVRDPQGWIEREAQQKLTHAASLFELLVMDGHPVHIDVYGSIMTQAALMGGEHQALDNNFTAISYSDAMGLFLAARHEREKDRSASALRKHAHSRISFALTATEFFDILRVVAGKLRVELPLSVVHLADELTEKHTPELTAAIPAGGSRPKTAPLPDKPPHGVSTMLAAHLAHPRPASSALSSRPAHPHAASPQARSSSATSVPLQTVAAHYSFLRADRTRSICRSLGHARLSLRSAGSVRLVQALQASLYGEGLHPPALPARGPQHPSTLSSALSHCALSHQPPPDLPAAELLSDAAPPRASRRRGSSGRSQARPRSCPPQQLRAQPSVSEEREGSPVHARAPMGVGRAGAGRSRPRTALPGPDDVRGWLANYDVARLQSFEYGGAGGAEASPMVTPIKFSVRAGSEAT